MMVKTEKTHFEIWRENTKRVAKSPDGTYYDAETWEKYDPNKKNTKKPSKKKQEWQTKALAARKEIVRIGGKALHGTKAEVVWAEQIRFEIVSKMKSMDAAIDACDPNGLLSKAKFWIDNRNRAAEIEAFLVEKRRLVDAFNASENQVEREALAAQHNTLTAAWGF